MIFFNSCKPVKLILTCNLERSIKSGHPWIYSDALENRTGLKGHLATIETRKGEILGWGIYNPESHLAFRVVSVGNFPITDELIKANLEKALYRREHILNEDTNGCRLIFGEGDRLPGLVCDIYNDTLVFQLDGDGPARFWNTKNIAEWVSKKIEAKSAYLKYRSDMNKKGEVLFGDKALKKVLFSENGIKFKVDIINGQKTGFFLDQRENRQKIRKLSKDKSVLNLFGYTGGFSVYAGAGGAMHVTTVDISNSATTESCENWKLNGLSEELHEAKTADVFDYVDQAKKNKKKWDIVIVDPPSFASSERQSEKAKSSYKTLLIMALSVLNRGGILAASCCSRHIDNISFYKICEESLSKANQRGIVSGFFNQPEDHPYPIACKELCYLKFVLIRTE